MIGNILKERRIYLKLSQRDLAKITKLPNSHISLIERDKMSPTIRTTESLLKGLGGKIVIKFDK